MYATQGRADAGTILRRTRQLRWAADQLAPGDSLTPHEYADFFDVTDLEMLTYVEANGFPGTQVHEDDDLTTKAYDGQYRIRKTAQTGRACYVVYYTERGKADEEKTHESLRAARLDAIRRVMDGAQIVLNEWQRQRVAT